MNNDVTGLNNLFEKYKTFFRSNGTIDKIKLAKAFSNDSMGIVDVVDDGILSLIRGHFERYMEKNEPIFFNLKTSQFRNSIKFVCQEEKGVTISLEEFNRENFERLYYYCEVLNEAKEKSTSFHPQEQKSFLRNAILDPQVDLDWKLSLEGNISIWLFQHDAFDRIHRLI